MAGRAVSGLGKCVESKNRAKDIAASARGDIIALVAAGFQPSRSALYQLLRGCRLPNVTDGVSGPDIA